MSWAMTWAVVAAGIVIMYCVDRACESKEKTLSIELERDKIELEEKKIDKDIAYTKMTGRIKEDGNSGEAQTEKSL